MAALQTTIDELSGAQRSSEVPGLSSLEVLPIGGDKDFGALVEHSGQLAENPTSASSPRPGQRALGITSSLGEFA